MQRAAPLRFERPQVDLGSVPFPQAGCARDLDVLGLPVHERAELIRCILDEFLFPNREPFGVDHFPADVVEGDRVRGEIEGVVLPYELRSSERPPVGRGL